MHANVLIVTGSSGLIGSEAVRHLAPQFDIVVGLDNDMRRYFFGDEASTDWNRQLLEQAVPNFRHETVDIRDDEALRRVFDQYGADIAAVIHTAAQPSHDWAAREPGTDFTVNANGTLNLLEATRRHCPEAAFVFTSTNKVYGDTPNRLPLEELERRYELPADHPYAAHGIDEQMSVDQNLHSLFGASKLAADVLVQEYGRYFGLKTGIFRAGCLTGPQHAAAQLHGFLAYLVKCAVVNEPYTIIGYRGKQVRDNIHARDLVDAFWHFVQAPRAGEVYNMGGGRHSNCSILEAIEIVEGLCARPMRVDFDDQPRRGDHIWYVSDVRKFQQHFPNWSYRYDLPGILEEIHQALQKRLA